ncbi:MAG: hypothetical protein JWR67_398 [Mucilaginibacter sp.]|nr:hypothetical protein [Mucilaginibacter sp.]MDB5109284.1 hypothetical protein [Mucilaginibacter sp.]
MKLLYLSLFTLLTLINPSVADPIDKVGELIGRGNVHELAKLFAPDIQLSLLDDANTYSKAQAELILEKFFAENKPISCKMLHKVNSSSSYRLGVVIINTDKGVYRAAFTLKDTNGNLQLIELRVESEKVK